MKNKVEDQFQGCYHSDYFTTGNMTDDFQRMPRIGTLQTLKVSKNRDIIKNTILIIIIITVWAGYYFTYQENKKLHKELKDLNSTLEYIDKRMDTLEFYRIPGEDKHVHR